MRPSLLMLLKVFRSILGFGSFGSRKHGISRGFQGPKIEMISSKIANFNFGPRGPLGLPHYPGPEDPKSKIDFKTFENIKKEGFMPNLSSLSQKTKKLGRNVLSGRFRRWTFQIKGSNSKFHIT